MSRAELATGARAPHVEARTRAERIAARARAERIETRARAALAEVPDPELPVVSVAELGIVRRVELRGRTLAVELLPTFVGCPALELMRAAVRERLAGDLAGEVDRVEVTVSYAETWTPARITAEGRRRLREANIAPPTGAPGGPAPLPLPVVPSRVPCPACGSERTRLDNPFGSSRCRSLYRCDACRQPFEAIKPV